MEWSEKTDHRLRKGRAQLRHALQGHDLRRGGIEVCAFEERVVDPRVVKYPHRGADGLDRLHAGGHDDRLAETGDVADERQVVCLAGADLEGGYADIMQEIGGRAGEGRGEIDHPQPLGIVLERDLVLTAQGIALHHLPDRDIGIGREDGLSLLRHLVFDDVRLMLDAFAARSGGEAHHLPGDGETAAVVDPDLRDHQRRLVGSDLTVGDFHCIIRACCTGQMCVIPRRSSRLRGIPARLVGRNAAVSRPFRMARGGSFSCEARRRWPWPPFRRSWRKRRRFPPPSGCGPWAGDGR